MTPDFTEYTDDQLAEAIKAAVNEAEIRLAAEGHDEELILVQKAHRKLNRAHRRLREVDVVQPFSSGGDKPDDGDD